MGFELWLGRVFFGGAVFVMGFTAGRQNLLLHQQEADAPTLSASSKQWNSPFNQPQFWTASLLFGLPVPLLALGGQILAALRVLRVRFWRLCQVMAFHHQNLALMSRIWHDPGPFSWKSAIRGR